MILQNINNEFWLVKNKEPLTLAVERLLPANALFRCLHDDEWTGATKKKMKYEQKWKLTTGTSQSEIFSHDLNVQQVHTWTVLAPNFATAMYTSSWQTRFLDKVLQMLLQQKQQLQNQLKMLRFGAKRHRRMWSLKLRKSRIILFIYLELQSDRTETSVEYQSKNYCEGSNWCRGILWCYSGFKLKNVLYVENNNAQEVSPIFCNISAFERQLKNI